MEQTYARKYRPTKLIQVVGNNKIKTQLKTVLSGEYRPQIILLQGPAGCGKTTLARLIAKEYSCMQRSNAGACDNCDSCKRFNEYIVTGNTSNLLNIQEYDCATIGKHEADLIIGEMQTPTMDGGWRCFLFDEAHLLTTQAMGALLKTLEEPFEKRLVVLCTTNPERLLETIRSRSDLQLTVEKPTADELLTLLERVCVAENVQFEKKALSVVANRSLFEPRTALKNLQMVVKAAGTVSYTKTTELLIETTDALYARFFALCTNSTNDVRAYLKFLNNVKALTTFKVFLDGLIAYVLRGLYIYNGIQVTCMDATEIQDYGKLFKKFTFTEILNILQALQNAQGVEHLELQFVLWGYSGPHKNGKVTPMQDVQSNLIPNSSGTAQEERAMGAEALNAEKESTPADLQTMYDAQNSTVAVDDVLHIFKNASIIKK